jgi:hypothetical protein
LYGSHWTIDFHNSSYGRIWTIPKSIHTYPISKPNYLTSFLITISYPYNYFTPFLIINSLAYAIAPTSKCEHIKVSTDFSFQTQFCNLFKVLATKFTQLFIYFFQTLVLKIVK